MFKFCQNNVLTIFLKKFKMKFIFKILIGVLIITEFSNANEVKSI